MAKYIYLLTYLHTYILNISLILTKRFLEAAVTIFNRKESSDIFLRLINETFCKKQSGNIDAITNPRNTLNNTLI